MVAAGRSRRSDRPRCGRSLSGDREAQERDRACHAGPGSGTYTINGRTWTSSSRVRRSSATFASRSRRSVTRSAWTSSRVCRVAASPRRRGRCATAFLALLEADPTCAESSAAGFLTRDARAKERKKAGLKKARKRPQFSKRAHAPPRGGGMGRRLFGTDGVRGVAGVEITAKLALALGRAAVLHSGLEVAAGARDPRQRESGEMLEAALAAGLASAGADVALGGDPADAGGAPARPSATTSISRPSSRRRTTPTPTTGSSSSAATASSSRTRPSRRSSFTSTRTSPTAASGSAGPATCRRRRRLPPRARRALRRLSLGGVDVARLRQRRDLRGRARRSSGASARTSRRSPRSLTGATSTTGAVDARRRPVARCASGGHDLGFAFDGDGDRVIAVDRDGGSSTATSCWRSRRCTSMARRAWPAAASSSP